MSLTFHSVLRKLYTEPSIGASCQIPVHLATRSQRRRFFINQPIRNKNWLWWPCLLTNRDEMSNLIRGPSIDASYQVWVHLAKRFQRRRFSRNQSIRNKNCLWWPCLLTNQEEMSTIYRGPSIYASYQVVGSFGQAVWEKILRNWPIRNKNCLWWPCLLMDRDEMSTLIWGPPIDASYHVSVHLAKRFQKRRFLEIGQSEKRIACGGHVY